MFMDGSNHIFFWKKKGLDPASRGFPLDSLDTCLDTTDAQFVDIMHTHIAFTTAMGHADFYPVRFT